MTRMKLTFLGTGTSTGVPVIGCQCKRCMSADPRDKRLRASALWEIGDTKIVVDAGPDFRMQMINAQCRHVDAILITHRHYDHIGGLDDVRGLNYSMHAPLNVYAEKFHADGIMQMYPYVFEVNKYPGAPNINLNVITSEPFEINGIKVEPIRVMHAKMPIFGYRIGDWAYITDASKIPAESMEKLRGLDVLVLNALRHEPHMSHFSISQALEVVEELKPRRTYFTHINHDFGNYAEYNHQLPEGVEMSYDGLVVE